MNADNFISFMLLAPIILLVWVMVITVLVIVFEEWRDR